MNVYETVMSNITKMTDTTDKGSSHTFPATSTMLPLWPSPYPNSYTPFTNLR